MGVSIGFIVSGKDVLDALELAINALEERTTNGDMIKAVLNPYKICEYEYNVHIYMTEEDFLKAEYPMNCDTSWWNAPYAR